MNPFGELDRFGERIAVVHPNGQTESYSRMLQQADIFCSELKRDELVAIECTNSWQALIAYLGCLRKGCPVLLVDGELDRNLLQNLYDHYSVSVVCSDASDQFQRIRLQGPETHESLALLLSTSGTTGSPKLVRLSLANLYQNALAIGQYLSLSAESTAITSLPQHYSFGLSVVNSHFFAGGRLALTDAAVTERRFWDHFHLAQVDSLSGVPTTLELLWNLRIGRMELPSLRTVTQAGGRLPEHLTKSYAELSQQKGWQFFIMYGQTEATARMSYLPPQDAHAYPTSIGHPIPGGKFELVDDQKRPICEPFVPGELVYHGPNVMLGYASEREDLSLGDVQFGHLATGDIAEFDDNGYYYIRGRKKRFIKLNGNRVGLDEVEAELSKRGLHVYTTGRDDMLLLVGLDSLILDTAAAMVAKLYRLRASMIGKFVVKEVPLSSSGKIQYSQLLTRYEQEGLKS